MSIVLTEEQRQALIHAVESPPHVIDPVTSLTYVLIPVDIYEQLQTLIIGDDARQMEPFLAELAPEDWENVDSPGLS